ncbi:hypothetical protein D2962_08275 [Biomaibacter acetigenes]|uniref:DUF7694 domain-containing protein n=1 Tax=Biomaibacter acetigenes TaxID=2316383 RepID=A0A3G2R5F7_9FIRM|nr:hypothetical protein [Biomaibacter acetigenes]AYO30619.1 hypothetical protein D2962_08275 [Biomaibacter acetigenes]
MKIYPRGKVKIADITCDRYETDTGCLILISRDDGRLHLSISHKERYPTWDEIKQARYDLLPRTKDFAMILPKDGEYVNLHPNCFHLWEVKMGDIA